MEKATQTLEQPVETTTVDGNSMLELILANMQTTDEREATTLETAITELTAPAVADASTDGDVLKAIDRAVAGIENRMSAQVRAIKKHPDYQALESKWQGVQRLVRKAPLGKDMKLYLWNVSREDVLADHTGSQNDILRTRLYDVICREPIETLGGEPFNFAVVGWQFGPSAEDMDLLGHMAEVAEQAQSVILAPAAPGFFGVDDFSRLMRHPGDLKQMFEDDRYAEWKAFRATTKARHVGLMVPRFLARLPYGAKTRRAQGLEFFEERAEGADSTGFVWSNLAYLFSERIAVALGEEGWPTKITGWQGGGRVPDLHVYTPENGGGRTAAFPPTDTVVDGLLEPALAELGFIAMQWKKGSKDGVFDAAVSPHVPKETNSEGANASAAVGARLPVLLATCRIGHYVKKMLKTVIGAQWAQQDIQSFLTGWIMKYVAVNKPLAPLKDATVNVVPVPGKPGVFDVKLTLVPWIGIEAFNVTLDISAPSPKPIDNP